MKVSICAENVTQLWVTVILNTGPVVGSHLQKAAHSHAEPDAATVTQQNVQNHLVPPALGKIRKQMHEEELWEYTHFSTHNKASRIYNK